MITFSSVLVTGLAVFGGTDGRVSFIMSRFVSVRGNTLN